MRLKEELSTLQEIPANWHWERELLLETRKKVELLIPKVNDVSIKNILVVILRNINEVLYANANFERNSEKISQINKGVRLIKEKTMTIDETAKKIEAEQARNTTPKKQGTIKKIMVYALTLFSLGALYSKDVNAQQTNIGSTGNQNKTVNVPQGGTLGQTSDGKAVVFPEGGSLGHTSDGRTIMRQQPQNTQGKRFYNYSNAQQYITQANEAYKKNEYNKIFDLSEEALVRINQGTLKATSEEIKKLKHARDIGNSYIK